MADFEQYNPERALAECHRALKRGWTLWMPHIFTTEDDAMLLIHDQEGRSRTLPDTRWATTDSTSVAKAFRPSQAALKLARYAFISPEDHMDNADVRLLGLVKSKPEESKIIAPVIVDFDYASTDAPELAPSNDWPYFRRQVWTPLDEIIGIAKDCTPGIKVSQGIRDILDFYNKHETEIDAEVPAII